MLIWNKLLVFSALMAMATGLSVRAADPSLDPKDHPGISEGQSREPAKKSQVTPFEPRPDYAQLRRSVRQYESQIAEMEKNGGAYSDPVGEASAALGRAYMDLGEYQNALDALNRSLHIIRVNHGPDSPGQLPVLDLIIATNMALSDWKSVDENYDLLYWTGRRSFKNDNARLLNLVYRIARWHLNAYLKKYDPVPYKHLLESEKIFHDAVDIIESRYGPEDPRLIEALNGIAISDYHISSHIFNANSSDEMDEIRSSSSKMSHKHNVSSELVWYPVKYTNMERKKVLERIADIYAAHPELPVADRAVALVNLGDWELIYGWRAHALKNYSLAYQLLSDAHTDTETIDKLFREPVRIPTMTMNYPDNADSTDAENTGSYVRLSFEVTGLGCARRIKVVEDNNTESFIARINAKKLIQSSMFRPRLKGGKTVTAREVFMKLSGDALKHKEDRTLVNYEEYPRFIATKRCGHIK